MVTLSSGLENATLDSDSDVTSTVDPMPWSCSWRKRRDPKIDASSAAQGVACADGVSMRPRACAP
jgi:hypothetical protein